MTPAKILIGILIGTVQDFTVTAVGFSVSDTTVQTAVGKGITIVFRQPCLIADSEGFVCVAGFICNTAVSDSLGFGRYTGFFVLTGCYRYHGQKKNV